MGAEMPGTCWGVPLVEGRCGCVTGVGGGGRSVGGLVEVGGSGAREVPVGPLGLA